MSASHPRPRRVAAARALPLRRVAPATRALLALVLTLPLGLGLALAVVTSAQAAERKSPIAAGQVAPEIKLGDQHGRAFALGEVLKQRDFVVLAFYPKAFTSG
jgi:hypothetical protein